MLHPVLQYDHISPGEYTLPISLSDAMYFSRLSSPIPNASKWSPSMPLV